MRGGQFSEMDKRTMLKSYQYQKFQLLCNSGAGDFVSSPGVHIFLLPTLASKELCKVRPPK